MCLKLILVNNVFWGKVRSCLTPLGNTHQVHLLIMFILIFGGHHGQKPLKTVYFLSVIDDYSINLWVFALKSKIKTFQRFKEWLSELENEIRTTLKYLRTNNGLEFVSEEFQEFYMMKGIKWHRTVPGNP